MQTPPASVLTHPPRRNWYNPTGYQSNIDLSGNRPLPQGVTNLSDEPIVGMHGANFSPSGMSGGHQLSCLSPTGGVNADSYATFKKHIVSDNLKNRFI